MCSTIIYKIRNTIKSPNNPSNISITISVYNALNVKEINKEVNDLHKFATSKHIINISLKVISNWINPHFTAGKFCSMYNNLAGNNKL